MGIYWSYKSIPELKVLTKADRDLIVFTVRKDLSRDWKLLMAVALVFPSCILIGAKIGDTWGLVIGAALAWFLVSQFRMHFMRPYIKEILEDEVDGGAA